ncbi:MAG: hypothetical protein K9G80_03150 [Candidatus Nanopelagicales bacterium]|nr:hypothetical protein [Candidatus Nanopelagicales bacterium]MCF8556001.1 hypothetical protein [Candidatus Nanopelagicales bacterium]
MSAHRRTRRIGLAGLGLVTAITTLVTSTAGSAQAASPSPTRAASDRVDNLRFHRIDSGPLDGRLVMAGRFDHVESSADQDVRVRLTLRSGPGRDSASVIARTTFDYQIPAGIAPQNSPVRWLLTPRQSAAIDTHGENVVAVVDIWQNGVDDADVMAGHRHSGTASGLRILPSTTDTRGMRAFLPSLPMLLGDFIFRGEGITLYTSEDDSMSVYVDQVTGPGWSLQPSWATAVPSISSSSGPGSGYVGPDGSWSFQSTMGAAGCAASAPAQMAATGQFVDQGGAVNLSWADLTCPFGLPPVAAGSASGLDW